MSLKIAKINFSIPAGQTQEFGLVADFYRLDIFPTGLLVGLNGGPAIVLSEGYSQQGVPGLGEVNLLRIENPTGGTLTGAFSHGTGQMNLPGVTTLSGTIPLPSGASTAALQTTGNSALAGIQTSAASLVAVVTETPDFVTVAASTNQNFANCRSIAIGNTGATSITVTIGANVRTLGVGQSVGWDVAGPFNKLATVNVAVPAGGEAIVATTV